MAPLLYKLGSVSTRIQGRTRKGGQIVAAQEETSRFAVLLATRYLIGADMAKSAHLGTEERRFRRLIARVENPRVKDLLPEDGGKLSREGFVRGKGGRIDIDCAGMGSSQVAMGNLKATSDGLLRAVVLVAQPDINRSKSLKNISDNGGFPYSAYLPLDALFSLPREITRGRRALGICNTGTSRILFLSAKPA